MARQNDFKIVLSNGEEYLGKSFGAKVEKVCKLVFNTSMVGYQEIISDPCYAYQGVVMTYPVIGNYGITDENDNRALLIGGLIVRDYNDLPSNFRSVKTLGEGLEENGVPAIYGLDTRKLTGYIREKGEVKAIFTDITTPTEEAVKKIEEYEFDENPVKKVSCKKKWYSRTVRHKFTVAVIDCGVRHGLIKNLNSLGCNVVVLPYSATEEEISSICPDGVVISNGPSNPELLSETIETVNKIKGKYPILAVGLGANIVALSYGAKIEKLPFGHNGCNHPVRNLKTGKIEIVTERNGYAINEKSVEKTLLTITHKNVLDGTVEGVSVEKDKVCCLSYYPDSLTCEDKINYIYEDYLRLMEEVQNG